MYACGMFCFSVFCEFAYFLVFCMGRGASVFQASLCVASPPPIVYVVAVYFLFLTDGKSDE